VSERFDVPVVTPGADETLTAEPSGAGPDVAEAGRVGLELPGGWRVRRFLGCGGMGSVFAAQRRGDPGAYAIKFLRSELVGRANAVARFRREAELLSELDDPHIVKVVDVGHADDRAPFIVMELLEGRSLRAASARGQLSPIVHSIDVVMQACAGLSSAHEKGIVHRDLKPENLFLARGSGGREQVKIVDFGIAKLADAGGAMAGHETSTGALVGTLSYMAPEQVRGDKQLDARADVYALGCVLYELLSGRRAHDGQRPHEVLYSVLHREPVPLTHLCDGIEPELAGIVARALAKERAERTPDVTTLARQLETIALRTPSDAVPVPLSDAARATQASLSNGTTRGTAAEVPHRNDRLPRLGWTLLSLLVAGGVGLHLGRASRGEPASAPVGPATSQHAVQLRHREEVPTTVLRFVTQPASARVEVDGRSVAVGDLLSTRAGRHQIRARAAGYEPEEVEIVTDGGETRTLHFSLARHLVPRARSAPATALRRAASRAASPGASRSESKDELLQCRLEWTRGAPVVAAGHGEARVGWRGRF